MIILKKRIKRNIFYDLHDLIYIVFLTDGLIIQQKMIHW
jgi:hypothetical protein